MSACIHGNVCREWMRMVGCAKPLVLNCPNECPYFKEAISQDAILGEATINKLCDIVMELAKKRGDHDA